MAGERSSRIVVNAERLVAAARCLLPLVPLPSDEAIDDIIVRLAKALEVPFTVESDAKMIWRRHVAPYRRAGVER